MTFSKGLSVFFWEGVSTLVDGTSAIVAVSVASLFVHACCCNLAINVFQRPWSGRPFPIVDEVHGSTADYRCLTLQSLHAAYCVRLLIAMIHMVRVEVL